MDALSGGQGWGDQLDPTLQEPATEREGVVTSIANEPVRLLPSSSWPTASYSDRRERLRRKLGLTRASTMEGNSQRKTLAICQYHKLCAFALARLTDVETPLFAGMKVASMKHSLQRIRP
jgi:hypothetical protein